MKFKAKVLGKRTLQQRLRKRLSALTSDEEAFVGVPKAAGAYSDGTSMAVVAAVQEFGSNPEGIKNPKTGAVVHIPERSFLRAGLRNARETNEKILKRFIPLVLHGKMKPRTLLKHLASNTHGYVLKMFGSGDLEPNADSTIKAKGSSAPLIDTGGLRGAITYDIRPKMRGKS